jgi:hypothetical protein
VRQSSPLPRLSTSLLSLATVALALVSAVGCAMPGMKSRMPNIRPAAQSQDDPRLLFAPPMALLEGDDVIVRVVGPQMNCSGTLVEDDLVLTAHHCVVERGAHGEYKKDVLAPSALSVELGGDYLPWGNVGVKAVVAPPCGEAGGAGDLAVLVLTRKLAGMRTANPLKSPPPKARLDHPPEIGEDLSPAGFGRCALSDDGIRRKVRPGGHVRALTGETIELSASICPGDSGGPVISRRTNEIVGVISLSAMDGDETTKNLSVFARIDAYRKVFGHARAIADGASLAELPPLECQ